MINLNLCSSFWCFYFFGCFIQAAVVITVVLLSISSVTVQSCRKRKVGCNCMTLLLECDICCFVVLTVLPLYYPYTELWGAGVVVCLERGADLHMAQLMPLPLTVSCFSEIQIGFAFLVPAHPGSPGKRAVTWVCVCVCTLILAGKL